MATKPPSNGNRSKSPVSKAVTQAVQKLQGKVNFNAANFKSGKQTPELRIKEAKGKEQIYPLVGDRLDFLYCLGNSFAHGRFRSLTIRRGFSSH